MNFLRFFLLILLLASCGPAQVDTSSLDTPDIKTRTASENIGDAYPSVSEDSTYPSPVEIIEFEEQLLSESGTGTLQGMILLNGRPVVDVNIFLASTLTDDQGVEIIAEMDVIKSPRSYTNSEGKFTVTNIPPGRYALILDIAVKSFLLVYPDSQETILVSIEADQTNDLGTLDFSDLPIPDTYVK